MHTQATPAATPRPTFGPLATAGIFCFALSLTVHVLSYAGIAAEEAVPVVWGLHVGIFPLFFVYVRRSRKLQRGWMDSWGWVGRYLPGWGKVLMPALFAYAAASFFLSAEHFPKRGQPDDPDPVRSHENAIYAIRAFSGLWMIFYAIPTLFFLYVPAGAAPDEREKPARGERPVR